MTDSIVTPENTQLIARRMGYESDNRGSLGIDLIELIETDHNGIRHIGWFDPIANAEQSREIEEKLLDLGWRIHKWFDSYYLTIDKSDAEFKEIEAETLPLAIYKAALMEAKK